MEELPGWFYEMTEDKVEQLKGSIRTSIEEIEDLKKLAREKLDELAKAKLRNPNIPERVKQIMEGSRNTYINFNKIFLDKLDIDPEPDFEELKEFITSFEEASDSLAKSSGKSFMVLQEFFAQESAEVARYIKKIESKIRSLLANDYPDMMNVQDSITDLDRMMKEKFSVEEKIEGEEKNLASIQASIKESENNIEMHKQSDRFRELETLKKEEIEAKEKLKHCDEELRALLSPLDKALRKYERVAVENEKLIKDYLDSSLEALIEDKDLRIISMLDDLKSSIKTGSVELKDSDKIQSRIEDITTEKIGGIRQKCNKLKDKLSEYNRRIRLNPAARELEELEYKLEHLKDKKRRSEEETVKLRKQLLKLDTDELKQRIADKVKEILDVELEIED